MAHKITLPFSAIKLHFQSGGKLVTPLFESQSIFVNEAVYQLAGRYAQRFQDKILNKGAYTRILKSFPGGEFYSGSVLVPFKAAKNSEAYPDFELSFDYYYRHTEKGFWAIVPTLGVECYVNNEEDFDERLISTIRMDFIRKKRLNAVQKIVSTIWFDRIEMQSQEVELSVPTLTELNTNTHISKKKYLPKVAKRLSIDRREVYGRKTEMDLLARAVKGKYSKNVLLVGPSGVGKTALVWELSRQLKKRKINGEIWETTASTMIKELMGQTGWQDSLAFLCSELAGQSDFLFIRNLMELFEVGQYEGNSVSMADFLKIYINRGELNLISECTEEELAKIELRSPNYTSSFQIIRLQEPKDDLEEIVINKVVDLAALRKIKFELEAIKETIRLNRRFSPYAGFPGKPIRFLESILINTKNIGKTQTITRQQIIEHFCEEAGMPQFLVDPEIPMDLKAIKTDFKSELFGQDQAVNHVVDLIGSVKTALSRTGKPIASFLFIGPTGVGKTEMAKILAKFTFGSRDKMIRFDMSEYSDAYAITRLTGTSYYTDGVLTSAIRREPFCVLLFDEIEKAHPSFNDLLLQMLGEGRLSDSRRQLVNFCSTIIIMTSNIGATGLMNNRISWKQGMDNELVSNHFVNAVQKHFRPELFNRIDQVIPFEPLGKDTIRYVIERELNILKKREGIRFRNMDYKITDEAVDYLAEKGFNTKYGARELQRTVREQLVIPLSKQLNLLEFDEQLVVEVLLKNGQIELKIESDPLSLELLMEELEKINQADHASELRRSMSKLLEGHSYLNMLSQLDILERTRKLLGQDFYKNKKRTQKYSQLFALNKNFLRLKEEIFALEMEMGLQCMEFKNFDPKLEKKLTLWKENLLIHKVELFSVIFPDKNVCHFHIYGMNLEPVLNFYLQIFKKKNFEFNGNSVWLAQNKKGPKTREDVMNNGTEIKEEKKEKSIFSKIPFHTNDTKLSPLKATDRLVGIELKLKANCVHLFLKEESGNQKWYFPDRNGRLFKVMISATPFDTPDEIHRKEFYKVPGPRRIIHLETIKDNPLNINKTLNYKEHVTVVLEALEKQFVLNLDKALT